MPGGILRLYSSSELASCKLVHISILTFLIFGTSESFTDDLPDDYVSFSCNISADVCVITDW